MNVQEISKKLSAYFPEENIKWRISATTQDKTKIETEIGNYALRKSTKVEVIDEKLIPEEYFNIKVDKSVDKTALKEVLKSKEIPGVKLTTGFNLNIQ